MRTDDDAVSHRCRQVSEASVVACCFSPCGQMFVTGCSHGDLKLWDLDMNLLSSERDAHDLGVTCCCFAPQFTVGKCCFVFFPNLCRNHKEVNKTHSCRFPLLPE